MRKKAEKELNNLCQNSYSVFCFRRMEEEGGTYEEETDGGVLLKKKSFRQKDE